MINKTNRRIAPFGYWDPSMVRSKRYWFVVADRRHTKIFEKKAKSPIMLIREFQHPTGRLNNKTASSDILISKEIVDFIETSRNNNKFDEFFLIAEPRLLGAIKNQLKDCSQKLMRKAIKHDYVGLHQQELESRLLALLYGQDHAVYRKLNPLPQYPIYITK